MTKGFANSQLLVIQSIRNQTEYLLSLVKHLFFTDLNLLKIGLLVLLLLVRFVDGGSVLRWPPLVLFGARLLEVDLFVLHLNHAFLLCLRAPPAFALSALPGWLT